MITIIGLILATIGTIFIYDARVITNKIPILPLICSFESFFNATLSIRPLLKIIY